MQKRQIFYEVYSYFGLFKTGTVTHIVTQTMADALKFINKNPIYYLDVWEIMPNGEKKTKNIL
jgi:hypothetical protein